VDFYESRALKRGLLLVLLCLSWSASARATVGGPDCSPYLEPMAPTLPANTPFRAFLQNDGPPPAIRLVREDAVQGDVDVPLTVDPIDNSTQLYRVAPEGLVVGAAHRFEYRKACSEVVNVDRFVVGAEAPFPTTLGTVSAVPSEKRDPGEVLPFDLRLALDPAVVPWADFYEPHVMVDGEDHHHYGTTVSNAVSEPLMLHACGLHDTRVADGPHTVQIVARARAFDAPDIASTPLVVDVRCPKEGETQSRATDGGSEGCAFGRASAPGVGLGLGTLGLVGLIVARRRRAR